MDKTTSAAERIRPILAAMQRSIETARGQRMHGSQAPASYAPSPSQPHSPAPTHSHSHSFAERHATTSPFQAKHPVADNTLSATSLGKPKARRKESAPSPFSAPPAQRKAG